MNKIILPIIAFVIIAGIAFYISSNNNSIKTTAQTESDKKNVIIKVDGSSTVYPITEAVAEEFQKENSNVKVTVGIAGTGGGFKKFCSGETDISNASRPIKSTEIEACIAKNIEYVEIPIAYDGLAVLVNPENTWVNEMTVEELKKLWEPSAQKKIMKWNQIRPEWPDEEIHLFGPGVDSGTFDYFTAEIAGEEGKSRGDYTASEDDNVLVQGIATDKYALGYFGVAYYTQNKDKLKLVAINDEKDDNGAGAVLPDYENVLNGTYRPLSRPLLIYVSTKALKKSEVKSFIDYYLAKGSDLIKEVGYIALPSDVVALSKKRYDTQKTGSIFSGDSAKGLTVKQVLESK